MKKILTMILLAVTILSRSFISGNVMMVVSCVDGYEVVSVFPTTWNDDRKKDADPESTVNSFQLYERSSHHDRGVPQPKTCGK